MEYNIFTVEENGSFGESHDFQEKPQSNQKVAFELGTPNAFVNVDGEWVSKSKDEAFAVITKLVTADMLEQTNES